VRVILSLVILLAIGCNHSVSAGPPSEGKWKNWGLAESKVFSAWTLEEDNADVVVAVIDTGVDFTHKSLAANAWHDPAEHYSDIYGWNFVNNHANPVDDHGHGTHIAGIISAVAHHVSIMSVKYYSDSNTGSVNLLNTVNAINYAVRHHARIINYSGGGPEANAEEALALKKAEAAGILVVSAAGNEHQNIDTPAFAFYPASYRFTNIISVASTDIHNNLLASSNWGKNSVDVAAPGEHIFSTLPGGRYGYMSGTSQATAFVSGIAALMLSCNSHLTPIQLKTMIMQSSDRFLQLHSRVRAGGRVNAFSALKAACRANIAK
jgi:thermitase